jgi:hypothetical protein
MIPAILGTATLVGAAAGYVVAVVVHWEVSEFLIRHSRYKHHANGRLWTR